MKTDYILGVCGRRATPVGPINNLILWNKLGSTAEVTNSEIGPNLWEVGTPTYAAGKFDNGFNNVTSAQTNHIKFTPDSAVNTSARKGSCGFWLKVGAGGFQPGGRPFSTDYTAGGTRILLYENGGQFVLWIGDSATNKTSCTSSEDPTSWAADEEHYIQCVWDRAGAGDKAEIYIDGVKDSSIGSNNAWADADFEGDIILGTVPGYNFYTNCVIDNLWWFDENQGALTSGEYNSESL